METVHVRITGEPTHHFFVVDGEDMWRDSEGRVRVWTDRDKAISAWLSAHRGGTCITIGMGDAKWERFCSEQKYVLEV